MKTNTNKPVRNETAHNFFNNPDLENLMSNLYGRWLDECKYEKIEDYAAPIKPMVEAIGGEFLKMNKRPFGFNYRVDGIVFQIRLARNSMTYGRITQ